MLFSYLKSEPILSSDHNYWRVQFIRSLSLLLILPLLAYAVYNGLIQNWIFVILPALSAAVLLIVNIEPNWFDKTVRFGIVFIYVLAVLSLILGKKQYYSLIWMTGIPVLTYYLLGYKKGLKVNAAFLAFLFLFLLALPRSVVPARSIANVLFCMLFMTIALYSYEKSRDHVQAALEEKRRELEKISSTDSLTGLYNRVKIDHIIENKFCEIAARPVSAPVALYLLLIDLDDFKKINDTYGHQQGDKALKAVAATLAGDVQGSGIAARWGGEEFLLFLHGFTFTKAIAFADTVRHSIEQLRFENGMTVTISLGLAAYHEGDTYDTLLKRADDCLYKAKNHGRNRIIDERDLGSGKT